MTSDLQGLLDRVMIMQKALDFNAMSEGVRRSDLDLIFTSLEVILRRLIEAPQPAHPVPVPM